MLSLSTGRPNDGRGWPNTGKDQPNDGTGQPNTGKRQPNTAEGQPNVGRNQPINGTGRPNVGKGQPNAGKRRPNMGEGQPDVGTGRANAGKGQPIAGKGRPAPRPHAILPRWPSAAALLILLAPASPGEIPLLTPVLPLEGSLAPGKSQAFDAELTAGKTYRVSAEQQGIDLILEVRDPGAVSFATVDGPLERWGTEEILLRAETSGIYRIEVRCGKKGIAAGRYRLGLEEVSHPERIAALEAMTRAGALLHRGAPGSLEPALAAYQEARDRFRTAGDRQGEAEATTALAAVSRRLGRLKQAAELYADAGSRWQALAQPAREIRAWNDLGLTDWDLGDLPAADAALARGLDLSRSAGDSYSVADLRQNQCLVMHARGEIRLALDCYREALALFRQLGEIRDEGTVLNNLGYAFYSLGEPGPAEESYRRALEIRRETGDRPGEAQALNNLAVLFRGLGEIGAALTFYGEAREILASLDDRRQEAATLNNLGVAYNSLGETERARIYFKQALELRRKVEDRRGEIVTLNNLGWLERSQGEPAAAVPYHRQALELARATADRRSEALSLSHLAEAQTATGHPAEAVADVDQALDLIRQVGDRLFESIALRRKGEALASLGDPVGALPVLDQALALTRAVGNRANEAEILTLRARTLRDTGRLAEARNDAEAAVAVVESVRSRLGSPDLRSSYLGSRQEAFEVWIDVLMRLDAAHPGQGFDRAALEASERARARTLLDFLRASGSEARSSVAPDLLSRRRDLERRLALKADRRQGLLGSGKNAAGTAETVGARALEAETEQIAAELDLVDAEIRRQDPRYSGLVQGEAVSVAGIQALLDPGTLLLEYSLGRERSYLWAVGPDSLRAFVLPGREEIERSARALHEALSTPPAPGEDRSRLGADLSRVVLGPVANGLGDRRLAIVADGALLYIPFSVLPEPAAPDTELTPLVRRHETVELPSASALAAVRRQLGGRAPAPQLAIVLADPVFSQNDSRILTRSAVRGEPGASPAPGRLRFSRLEAEEIEALAPPGALNAELDFAASRDLALSGRLRDYRYVHFATHGVFDTARPELSGLLLSRIDAEGRPREGFLGLRDLYNLELSAEVVVLSGCQTALGKEIRGEGLLGLTRGFLYAGAPRVVASLWQVDDRATAELMSRFYRGLWAEGLPPAAALRRARLSLAAERRFRDPFYWGAFVLEGDWQVHSEKEGS